MLDSQLTRRKLIKTGAAAGLAAMLVKVPTTFAAAAEDDVAPTLKRATYGPLVGSGFLVAGKQLTLDAVCDLEHLPGRDDAFRLAFSGAGGVASGTQTFYRPALGRFDLFVSPVGEPGHYEVVIDRSIILPHDPPSPATAAAIAAAPVAVAAQKPAVVKAKPKAKKKVVKHKKVKHRKLRHKRKP